MTRLYEATTVDTLSRKVAVLVQRELDDAQAQSEQDSSRLPAWVDPDRDMFHSAGAFNFYRTQSKKAAKREANNSVFADACQQSLTQVDLAREDLHSTMRHRYESCLPFILAHLARCTREYVVVYSSATEIQLRANWSTVEQSVHSISTILYQSQEHLHGYDAPPYPQ